VSKTWSARAFMLLVAAGVPLACAARDEIYVYNRTNAVLQLGFGSPVAACTEAVLPLEDINNPALPLVDGAWRPTTQIAVAEGEPEPRYVLVTSGGTQWLNAPPPQLGPCEGDPVDWAP
jgi:hypothetical protein